MIAELKNSLCLSHAAREWFPPARTGNSIHPSVLSRWSDRGIRAANGQIVRLKTWRVGGQRMTSKESVEAFLAALNSDSSEEQQANESDVSRRGREASQALERLGA